MRMRNLTIALALVAVFVWCSLLFGIGLDDLANGRTEPGVIFSVSTLALLIVALVAMIWKVAVPRLKQLRQAP